MTVFKKIIKSFNSFSKPVIALCLVGLMYSCFDIELTERAQVTLITEWEELSADVSIPNNYTVIIGDEKLNLSGLSNSLPDLIPGDYTALIYNEASHVFVNNSIASVTQDNGVVASMPGWFFSGYENVSYRDDAVDTVRVKMKQQIGELRIVLLPEGGSKNNIKEIKTTLTGVAGSWDLKNNRAIGSPIEVNLPFTKQVDGTWLAVVRLIGVIGNQQNIKGEIIFDGSAPKNLQVNTDISASLSDFNVKKYHVMSFSGKVETPTEAGFTVGIIDWKQVNETGTAW